VLPEELRTKHLALRPFALHDVDALLDDSSDPDYARHQSIESPFNRRDAERAVAEPVLRDWDTAPAWAITLDAAAIGIVSMNFHAEHRIAAVGYGVPKAHWGKGFCGEAVRAAIDASFDELEQLKRVRAHIDARNAASARVLLKLGFTLEGTLRSDAYAKGEFVDAGVYGLLREEW